MGQPIVFFEIGCRDKAFAAEFYSKMFDWNVDPTFNVAAESAGLSGHFNSLGHEPHNYTMFYVAVDDVAAAIAKATGLGGKLIVGPITILAGTFAWIQDTAGNTLGLLKRS